MKSGSLIEERDEAKPKARRKARGQTDLLTFDHSRMRCFMRSFNVC